MSFWENLENELVEFNNLNRLILMKLNYYEREIRKLLESIREVDFSCSNEIFDKLFSIQEKIVKIKYKYNFNLNNFLNDFVYFFDRNDEYQRKYLFEHFKKNLKFPEQT